jgi:hypothetical protein
LPFCLYIGPNAKNLREDASIHKKFHNAAAIEDKFEGIEVFVPAPCQDR